MIVSDTWTGPLTGLRILEVGSDISAAFGTRALFDLGAEVIKIEPPSGDPTRRTAPFANGSEGSESALFGYLNRGKRSAAVDITTEDGRELLLSLAACCDAVVTDSAHFSLLEGCPMLPSVVAISPFGIGVERSATPFTMQHASGFAFHQASPVTDPAATPPVACADWEGTLVPGLVVASATLWAIAAADNKRPAPIVDLAAADILTYLLVEQFADVQVGLPVANRRRDPARGITIAGGLIWFLPCRNGSVMVSPREDHQWDRWIELMGRPDWSNDQSLCGGREKRTKNAAELQRRMAVWSAEQSAQELARRAQEARVACFPVSTPDDLMHNDQLRHRNFFDVMTFANGATVEMAGMPFTFKAESGKCLPRGRQFAHPAVPSRTAAFSLAESVRN